ncbi:MAG TPA: hypothetical protein VIK49_01410 [Steroidobacteraceae bacterium]
MPKYPRTFLSIATALAAGLLATAAIAAERPDPKATYDRIQSLAGTWNGRMEDPLSGPPVTVRYEVVSGGKAVIEYQNPGQSFEMVTVYYLAAGDFRATHYCGAGNQPAWRLGKDSTADLVQLEFDGGTGFDPDRDGHVHQGEIRFISTDRIEHRWFHYVGPKEQGVTHWFLDRELPKPAEPAEPATPPAPESPVPAAA